MPDAVLPDQVADHVVPEFVVLSGAVVGKVTELVTDDWYVPAEQAKLHPVVHVAPSGFAGHATHPVTVVPKHD